MSERTSSRRKSSGRSCAAPPSVFAQDGYEGASMSRIAAWAGVSKGTLYNYFDGKAELFAAWVGRECERNLAHVFDIGRPGRRPGAGLRAIGERMLR